MLYKDEDEYEYFKKELLKESKKGKFYQMSNRILAFECLMEAEKEFPEIEMYEIGIEQFFCLNDKAKKAFRKLVKDMIKQKKKEEELLNKVLII